MEPVRTLFQDRFSEAFLRPPETHLGAAGMPSRRKSGPGRKKSGASRKKSGASRKKSGRGSAGQPPSRTLPAPMYTESRQGKGKRREGKREGMVSHAVTLLRRVGG